MFIQLKHKSLNVYLSVKELVNEVYKLSILLPQEEKFNMVQQIRRAALSVKLNLQKDVPGNQQSKENVTWLSHEVQLLKLMPFWK